MTTGPLVGDLVEGDLVGVRLLLPLVGVVAVVTVETEPANEIGCHECQGKERNDEIYRHQNVLGYRSWTSLNLC
jgi:hypothetical protein